MPAMIKPTTLQAAEIKAPVAVAPAQSLVDEEASSARDNKEQTVKYTNDTPDHAKASHSQKSSIEKDNTELRLMTQGERRRKSRDEAPGHPILTRNTLTKERKMIFEQSVNPASRLVRRMCDQLSTTWHAKVEDRIQRYNPFPAVAAALDGDTGPADAYQRDVVPDIVRFGQAVQDNPAFQRVQ
jgi:hypothetical protein